LSAGDVGAGLLVAVVDTGDDEKKKRSVPASLAATSMWVLISTDSMHSALWFDEAHAAHSAAKL